MKKIILFSCALFLCTTIFAQKKVTTPLAKADNLTVEVKSGSFQIIINENGKAKDFIAIKTVDAKFSPTNCKLTSFKASGKTLYLLTWTEKVMNKTSLKTEDIANVYSNVYDIASKKLVFYNTQKTNNITEKVFLDKNKTASETQQKVSREGFELTLNADGSLTQKTKTQEYKWVFDAAKMEYVKKK